MRKPDYFGKFGKIHKVVINHSTQYAGSQLQVSWILTNLCMNNPSLQRAAQGPSASAYVTYFKSEDALRAIQAVNNIFIGSSALVLMEFEIIFVILRRPHSEGITWYNKVLFALHEKPELSQE